MTDLGFIGAGNMGSALIRGFFASEASKDVNVRVFDMDYQKTEPLKKLGADICVNEYEVVKSSKYVVLACKPQQLDDLLIKIKNHVKSDTVFISICAGISAGYIRERIGENTKVVLVMPNMPMLMGAGASAMAYDEAVTQEEFGFARKVVESCGIAEVIPIDKMNDIICINASAPAFIYLFSKAFIDYADERGINGKAALNLFAQTLIGSAKMLTGSGFKADELIMQVSSKGGTTVAGLDELYRGKLDETVKKACKACTERAYELGK